MANAKKSVWLQDRADNESPRCRRSKTNRTESSCPELLEDSKKSKRQLSATGSKKIRSKQFRPITKSMKSSWLNDCKKRQKSECTSPRASSTKPDLLKDLTNDPEPKRAMSDTNNKDSNRNREQVDEIEPNRV